MINNDKLITCERLDLINNNLSPVNRMLTKCCENLNTIFFSDEIKELTTQREKDDRK